MELFELLLYTLKPDKFGINFGGSKLGVQNHKFKNRKKI